MVDLLKLNTNELKAMVVYKDVLEKGSKFPKEFWSKKSDMNNSLKQICGILTRYCLENICHVEPADLPKYNLKQLKSLLVRYRLSGMVQIAFGHDVLKMLKNAYPGEFKSRNLKEWMWSKHGIWENREYIIEAVHDMVKQEGITNPEDIPYLNWKQRLLDHGIYNVLSSFNWSIFSLFDYVYPGKFHSADFKYKIKWSDDDSLENAFYHMDKTFKGKKFDLTDILALNTSGFRRLGLAGMLSAVFGNSPLKAKEYYLYKTIGNAKNQKELKTDVRILKEKKFDENIRKRLFKASTGGYIYNLHNRVSLYNYVKRHAAGRNLSISDFISSYGFTYKSAKKDSIILNKEDIWNLRKKGLTYVEIARKLNSNPTTITKLCNEHFGGDPLIPRPLENYITVKELMNKYRVDHKTIMKIVKDNNFENHLTIRLRYLKKSEIEPALDVYVSENKRHNLMIKRYAR